MSVPSPLERGDPGAAHRQAGLLLALLWAAGCVAGVLAVPVLATAVLLGPLSLLAWLAFLILALPLLALTRLWLRWNTTRRIRRVLLAVPILIGLGTGSLVTVGLGLVPPPPWNTVLAGASLLASVLPVLTSLTMVAVLVAGLRSRRVASRPSDLARVAGCPVPPRSDASPDLGFKRQPMVRWFDPGQLAHTGIKALVAGVFGTYSDKRELQAVEWKQKEHDYSRESELWIDYVADLGDGFDSTYSIASLLARRDLQVDGLKEATARGRILVLGGDQVYPTATRQEYQNRFAGPYGAALPCVRPPEAAPHLFAIPGNHDWYDGLTSFSRLFTQGRWIGGWQTQQSRSYFAIQLPHGWWLWGVDFQLTSDIDKPQLDYFRTVAARLQEGDRIILCTPEPSWVYCATKGESAYQNLAFFQKSIIAPSRGTLVLNLTGDLHHYCRYQSADGTRHKITAGGGGAYLYPTHRMPEQLTLPDNWEEWDGTADPMSVTRVAYRRASVYPSRWRSRGLACLVLRFPFRNPWFSLFLGTAYLFFTWILQSASKKSPISLMEALAGLTPVPANLSAALEAYGRAFAHSPASMIFAAVLVSGLVAFADLDTRGPRWWATVRRLCAGLLHGGLHLGLISLLIWVFARWNYQVLSADLTLCRSDAGQCSPAHLIDLWQQFVPFSLEMLLIGGALGVALVGLYLLLSNWILRFHDNEVLSSQGIDDYKNFLRLHLRSDGSLLVYPVKVERVCKAWRFEAGAGPGAAWFSPMDQLRPELIEQPIAFKAQARAGSPATPGPATVPPAPGREREG